MKDAEPTVEEYPGEIKLSSQDEMRFWEKVNIRGPNDCWEWTACRIKAGYGQFWLRNKMVLAHRIAWTLENGQIPDGEGYHGLCVCHTCDNPCCVNSSHLFLGTISDNNHDRDSKGRGNQARGDKNGARLHPELVTRGEYRWNSKLTEDKVRELRSRYAAGGVTCISLAREFGVSRQTANDAVLRKIWSHVA